MHFTGQAKSKPMTNDKDLSTNRKTQTEKHNFHHKKFFRTHTSPLRYEKQKSAKDPKHLFRGTQTYANLHSIINIDR